MILLRELHVADFKSLRDVHLGFPDRAAVLVDGLNEAGKSSLFESIYFALYGDLLLKDGSIDGAVRYGAEAARVDLSLSVAETDLTIRRTIRRGRPNRIWLRVRRPSGDEEIVTQLSAANRRIVAELGSLDGGALLNSCFVEQKKLDRIEDLSQGERLAALLKLLNLDRLTTLAQRYKVTGGDELALARARSRRELAEGRIDLPAAAAEVDRLDRRIALTGLAAALREAEAADREALATAAESEDLQDDRAAVTAALTDLDRLDLARQEADRASDRPMAELETSGLAAEQATARLAELDRLVGDDLPRRERRCDRLADAADAAARREALAAEADRRHRLAADREQRAHRLAEVTDQIDQDRRSLAADRADRDRRRARRDVDRPATVDRLTALQSLSARLDGLTIEKDAALTLSRRAREARLTSESAADGIADRRIVLAETEAAAEAAFVAAREAHERARDWVRRAEVARALEAWIAAERRAAGPAPRIGAADRTRSLERQAAYGWQSARSHARRDLILATAAVVLAIGSVAGAIIATPFLWPAALVLLLLTGLLLRQWTKDQDEVKVWEADLEVQRAATQGAPRGADPLADFMDPPSVALSDAAIRAALRQAEPWPRDREAAEARIRELLADLPVPLNVLQDQERSTDRAALEARLRWESTRDARQSLDNALGGRSDRLAEADRLADDYRRAAAAFNERAQAVLADAQRLGLGLDHAAVATEIGQATLALTAIDLEISRLGDLEKSVDGLVGRLATAEAARDALLQGDFPPDLAGGEVTSAALIEAAAAARAEAARAAAEIGRIDAGIGPALADLGVAPADVPAALMDAERALAEARARLADRPAVIDQRGAALTRLALARTDLARAARRLTDLGVPGLDRHLAGSRPASPAVAAGRLATAVLAPSAAALSIAQQAGAPVPNPGAPVPNPGEATPLPDFEPVAWRRDLEAWRGDLAAASAWIDRQAAGFNRIDLAARRGSLDQAIGAAKSRLEAAVVRQGRAVDRIAEGLDRIGAGDPPLDRDALWSRRALIDRLPDLADADPAGLETLQQTREDAVVRREQAAGRVADLEAQLQLAGVALDLDADRAEEAEIEHDLAVRRRASTILAAARDRLIERVLPNTEINLRLLLPSLTAGRYHDARIGQDYRIEVWDDEAGRFVVKQVFSGGTKDQLSLALRLAFALATLPQELGTTPGFLFLDEPLGSFDAERAAALVDLLTTGQVAANFAQIFVITHVRGFRPQAFSHHLRLANGRVVETDLDQPRPAEALALAEES